MWIALPVEENEGKRVKINPLANWTEQQVTDYINDNNLPKHPLLATGYRSVGCMPCTTKAQSNESSRDGRWCGQSKAECGIHFIDGKATRTAMEITTS